MKLINGVPIMELKRRRREAATAVLRQAADAGKYMTEGARDAGVSIQHARLICADEGILFSVDGRKARWG